MQKSHSEETQPGVWLFYLWFLFCVIFYLFKIRFHPLVDFQGLILTFQNSTPDFHQVLSILGMHLLVITISTAYLMLFLATGETILKKFQGLPFTFLERWIWSFALGLGFWGMLAQALALTGLFYPILLKGLAAGGFLLFLLKDRWQMLRRSWPWERALDISIPWKIVMGIFILLMLSNLLAPAMSWDAITYQLVLPRYELMHHGFYPVLGMVPAEYPALGQMFFSWGLIWGSDSIARFFCFWTHLATILTLGSLGSRIVGARVGWFAAVFYFFFPYLSIYSTRGYVDLFAGFYATLGLGLLVLLSSDRWKFDNQSGLKGIYFLIAFALGVVWAIKYNAIVYSMVAWIVWFWLMRQKQNKWFFMFWLVFLPFFFFGPWALKSWIFVHNPVYPYLPKWFHSFNWNDFDQKVSSLKFPIAGMKGIIDFPRIVWGIFFNRYGGAPHEEVGLFILAFAPLGLIKKPWNRSGGVLGLSIAVPLLFWLLTSHQLRLIAPVIALASLAVAIGFEQALRVWPTHAKWISRMPLLLAALSALYLFQGLLAQPDPFANFLGFQTKDEFLNQVMRPEEYMALNDYLNQTLPLNAKVLILGQQNGYYLRRESIFDFDYTYPVLKQWADESTTPQEFYAWFVKNGFDYLLCNSNGMMDSVIRDADLGVDRYSWNSAELENYEQFFLKYTLKIPLPVDDGYFLYKITPRNGFSTLPEFLPGNEKYYLDNMTRLMGLKRVIDLVGKSIPAAVYDQTYHAVAQQHPEFGYPCFQSALADLSLNKPDREVLDEGKMGLKRDGDQASWLALEADVFLSKGQFKRAVKLLEKAQQLGPEKDDVARNLSVAYYNEQRLDRAIQEAQKAVDLVPNSPDYRKLLSELESLKTRH